MSTVFSVFCLQGIIISRFDQYDYNKFPLIKTPTQNEDKDYSF